MFSTDSSGMAVAATVQDFQSRMGVNTHFNWRTWGTGPYTNPERIIDLIEYIGIKTVRDMMTNLHYAGLPYQRMLDAGLKWNFIIPTGDQPWPGWDRFSLQMKLAQFADQYPGAIASIEGMNEIWNWPVTYGGKTGLEAAQLLQREWNSFIKSVPGLDVLPTYDFTDLKGYGEADYTNVHHYGPMGDQPDRVLRDVFRDYPQIAAAGRPVVWTEFGWPTGEQVSQGPKDYHPGTLLPAEPWRSVNEPTQARLTLNGFAQGFRHDFKATMVYELINPWPGREKDGVSFQLGLFNSDYSPKQSAHALHRFSTALQRDDGVTDLHLNLKFSLDTADSQVFGQALRGDGNSFKILLWRERDLWDEGLNVSVIHAPSQIRLSLSGEAALAIFNPITGATTVWDGRGPLRLGDDMLVLELDALAPAADGNLSLALRDFGAAADVLANAPSFRFFHTQAGGHLFTVSAAEADHVRANLPHYREEGVAFLTVAEILADAVPIHRFFHCQAGGHFFTASETEAANVRANLPHYRDEGVGFHMSATPGKGLAPVYRFFHTEAGGHFFTASAAEAANVRATLPVYRDEGIAFYAPTRVADELFG